MCGIFCVGILCVCVCSVSAHWANKVHHNLFLFAQWQTFEQAAESSPGTVFEDDRCHDCVFQASHATPSNPYLDRLNTPLRFNGSPKKSSFASVRCDPTGCPPWPPCTDRNCKLPKCFCAGSKIPSDLKAGNTPQMVVLTFQNGINSQNYGFYRELFDNRRLTFQLRSNCIPLHVSCRRTLSFAGYAIGVHRHHSLY